MHNCYLYCITDQPNSPALEIKGIAGHEVKSFSYAGYHALYSILEGGRPDVGLLNLKIHNSISLIAMNNGTVLPFRYGTVVKNRESIGELLNGMSGRLKEEFTRFCGKIETGVKVFGNLNWTDEEVVENVPGFETLKLLKNNSEAEHYIINMAKNAYNARTRAELSSKLAESMFDPLSPVLCEKRVINGQKDGLLINGAFLIRKEHFEEFKTICTAIKVRYPRYSFIFSGPWPPYSFLDMGKEGVKSG